MSLLLNYPLSVDGTLKSPGSAEPPSLIEEGRGYYLPGYSILAVCSSQAGKRWLVIILIANHLLKL